MRQPRATSAVFTMETRLPRGFLFPAKKGRGPVGYSLQRVELLTQNCVRLFNRTDDLRKRRGEHSVSTRERCVTAAPPPSKIRSDKRESARRSVGCAERVKKRHTHIQVVSLSLTHRIVRNSRKLSDFTDRPRNVMFFMRQSIG